MRNVSHKASNLLKVQVDMVTAGIETAKDKEKKAGLLGAPKSTKKLRFRQNTESFGSIKPPPIH